MFFFIILFTLVTNNALCVNILYINPVESVSHHIWNEVLIGGLLEKGHNITLMSHMEPKIKSENYTVLRITGFEDLIDNLEVDMSGSNSLLDVSFFWYFFSRVASEEHLKSEALKVILDYPKDKFDLIIFDLVCGHEFYPLIEHFGNPPVVGVSPFSLPPYILDAMGSHFYYYYPFYSLAYTDDMTFLQRTKNTILYLLDYFFKWYTLPNVYKAAQVRYGEDITPFDQMEKRIGVLLANYDPILGFPLSLPPNIIPVGGLHVRRSEKLPNDLQEILDKASDGVIYFSFGTVVRPQWMTKETKKAFLNVFSKLKYTVLWKYTGDDLEDVPKNVIIRKWFSQTDILAHRNVKLFITHSGALSNQEVMYHGVPVLGIPFFADQKVIASKMETRKLGKQLHILDITEDNLYETILEILKNPIYEQNMQRTSQLYRDQKEYPLERAIFWIEYALRNKDMSHLSIKARDMTMFQRENLDVYGLILLFTVTTFVLFLIIIKYMIKRLVFKKKSKTKQH